MKTLLRSLSIAALMTGVSVALPAQTSTVVYGRTTISNSAFLQYVASFNVTVTDLEGTPAQTNPVTFPVKEGVVDLQSGSSEITNAGGYLLSGMGKSVRLQNFVLDSTVPSNPVLTALFIVNGKLVGRQPLFQVRAPSGVSLPLKPLAGTEEISGIVLTLTQTAATIINNAIIIGEPVLQPGEAAGTADVYTVLSPDNSDQ